MNYGYRCFNIRVSFGFKIRNEQPRHSTHGTRKLFGRIAIAALKSFEISFHRTLLVDIFERYEGIFVFLFFYCLVSDICQSIQTIQ